MHHYYFPEEELELQRELVHHPNVVALLNKHPPDEIALRLAEIATYCDVILDGTYEPEALTKLCGILAKRLKEKRLPPNQGILLLS